MRQYKEITVANVKHTRGFTSKFGFFMATAGSAIGLGNLWSFPYKTGQGGGAAFVFVYLIMMLLIGLVAMIAEFFLGKRAQRNVIESYTIVNKRFRPLGILATLTPFIILCYYAVIGGWSIKYAVDYIGGIGVGSAGIDYNGAFGQFISGSYMPIIFLGVFIIFVVGIVLAGVKKGIERASKILMPLLFICLLIVVVKSLTLPGASEGLKYLFYPDFSKLTGGAILSAMGQVFFSLSLGMGINVAYGSYMRKEMSIGKSAAVVGLLDIIMALLAGIAIFPAVFAFNLEPAAGPGLLFQSLANVFGQMSGGRVFGAVFFMLVILAAVTSSIALLEVPIQYLVEKFKWSRKILTAILGLVVFAIGSLISLSFGMSGLQIGGVNLLDVFDMATNKILLPLVSAITCILVGWYIKPKNAIREMEIKADGVEKMYRIWGILLQFVTPAAIFAILCVGFVEIFTNAEISIASQWAAVGIAVATIVGSFIISMVLDKAKKPLEPPKAEEVSTD